MNLPPRPALLKIAFVIGFFVLGLVPLLVINRAPPERVDAGRYGPTRGPSVAGTPRGILPSGSAIPRGRDQGFFKEEIIPRGRTSPLLARGPCWCSSAVAGMIVVPFGNQIGTRRSRWRT